MTTRDLATIVLSLVLSLLPQAALAAQADILPELETFLDSWQSGEADRLESVLHADGVVLSMDGRTHGAVQPRQAAAALEAFMEGRQAGTFTLDRWADAGGEPHRAFAEVQWETVMRGTSEPVGYTVFVGLLRGPNGWRVSEVRVL